MAILQSLGINSSFFIQIIIFGFAITFLSFVVFKPYLLAFEEREKQTKGGEELAVELQEAADDLKRQYEVRARKINTEIKTIFDERRGEAHKEYQEIIAKARTESDKQIEQVRVRVTTGIAKAAQELKADAGNVANLISQKLLTK